MLNIGSTTQLLGLKIPKGDTTFSYLVIDTSGKITEKIFKEVKDLHFEIND
jgi:hypothetical protein